MPPRKTVKKSRGRPVGSKNESSKRTKASCNLSLDLDVIAWLDGFQPEKSPMANRILKAAMLSGLGVEDIESILSQSTAEK